MILNQQHHAPSPSTSPMPTSNMNHNHNHRRPISPSPSMSLSSGPLSSSSSPHPPQPPLRSISPPLPPHSVYKHAKIKLEILVSKPVFVAGERVEGILELSCSAGKGVWLGEVGIELQGYEELKSLDHSSRQSFLTTHLQFQGGSLPPSNAVISTSPSLAGYYPARRGRTRFTFSFPLPSNSPSCVAFAGNARLSYTLKATAQVVVSESEPGSGSGSGGAGGGGGGRGTGGLSGGERSLVTKKVDFKVVESWDDWKDGKFWEPAEEVESTKLSFVGGNLGNVWLEVGVGRRLWWMRRREDEFGNPLDSGLGFGIGEDDEDGTIEVRVAVRNSSKRNLSGLKMTLARRLIFPVRPIDPKTNRPMMPTNMGPLVTETTQEDVFRGRGFDFPCGGEETVTGVRMRVPRELWTVRKTRLFEVQIVLKVAVELGAFGKDLVAEIPIWLASPDSLPEEARIPRSIAPAPAPVPASASISTGSPHMNGDAFGQYGGGYNYDPVSAGHSPQLQYQQQLPTMNYHQHPQLYSQHSLPQHQQVVSPHLPQQQPYDPTSSSPYPQLSSYAAPPLWPTSAPEPIPAPVMPVPMQMQMQMSLNVPGHSNPNEFGGFGNSGAGAGGAWSPTIAPSSPVLGASISPSPVPGAYVVGGGVGYSGPWGGGSVSGPGAGPGVFAPLPPNSPAPQQHQHQQVHYHQPPSPYAHEQYQQHQQQQPYQVPSSPQPHLLGQVQVQDQQLQQSQSQSQSQSQTGHGQDREGKQVPMFVAFDPNAPDLTRSRFFAGLGLQQQHQDPICTSPSHSPSPIPIPIPSPNVDKPLPVPEVSPPSQDGCGANSHQGSVSPRESASNPVDIPRRTSVTPSRASTGSSPIDIPERPRSTRGVRTSLSPPGSQGTLSSSPVGFASSPQASHSSTHLSSPAASHPSSPSPSSPSFTPPASPSRPATYQPFDGLPACESPTPEEQEQIMANMVPVAPYSGQGRARMSPEEMRRSLSLRRRSSAPDAAGVGNGAGVGSGSLPEEEQRHQLQQAVIPKSRSHGAIGLISSKPALPVSLNPSGRHSIAPTPSSPSQFMTQPPPPPRARSASFGAVPFDHDVGLETIGEDGESQAGTVRGANAADILAQAAEFAGGNSVSASASASAGEVNGNGAGERSPNHENIKSLKAIKVGGVEGSVEMLESLVAEDDERRERENERSAAVRDRRDGSKPKLRNGSLTNKHPTATEVFASASRAPDGNADAKVPASVGEEEEESGVTAMRNVPITAQPSASPKDLGVGPFARRTSLDPNLGRSPGADRPLIPPSRSVGLLSLENRLSRPSSPEILLAKPRAESPSTTASQSRSQSPAKRVGSAQAVPPLRSRGSLLSLARAYAAGEAGTPSPPPSPARVGPATPSAPGPLAIADRVKAGESGKEIKARSASPLSYSHPPRAPTTGKASEEDDGTSLEKQVNKGSVTDVAKPATVAKMPSAEDVFRMRQQAVSRVSDWLKTDSEGNVDASYSSKLDGPAAKTSQVGDARQLLRSIPSPASVRSPEPDRRKSRADDGLQRLNEIAARLQKSSDPRAVKLESPSPMVDPIEAILNPPRSKGGSDAVSSRSPARSSYAVIHEANGDVAKKELPVLTSRLQIVSEEKPQADDKIRPSQDGPAITRPATLAVVKDPSPSNYDVRSARGGRGGKVTAVASIWADAIAVEEKEKNKQPKPLTVKPKALHFGPAVTSVPLRPVSPLHEAPPARFNLRALHEIMKDSEQVPSPRPPVSVSRASSLEPQPKPAKSKRMSEPAVGNGALPAFLNTTVAKPTLAAPSVLVNSRQRASSDAGRRTNGTTSPSSPLSPVEVATGPGQAKLKALIQKYQQGAA